MCNPIVQVVDLSLNPTALDEGRTYRLKLVTRCGVSRIVVGHHLFVNPLVYLSDFGLLLREGRTAQHEPPWPTLGDSSLQLVRFAIRCVLPRNVKVTGWQVDSFRRSLHADASIREVVRTHEIQML